MKYIASLIINIYESNKIYVQKIVIWNSVRKETGKYTLRDLILDSSFAFNGLKQQTI